MDIYTFELYKLHLLFCIFELHRKTLLVVGLYSLLFPNDVPVPDDFKENKLVYWYEFFKIEKYETKNRKFANTIYTDGKVAVIRLRKPTFETPKPKDVNLYHAKVVTFTNLQKILIIFVTNYGNKNIN